MNKTIVVLAGALAALALWAAPAAGANAPEGNGLVSFGTFQCGGVGDVEVLGPRPPQVPAGFTTSGEKFVLVSLSVVFTIRSASSRHSRQF